MCPRHGHIAFCSDHGPKPNPNAKLTKNGPTRVYQRIFRQKFKDEVCLHSNFELLNNSHNIFYTVFKVWIMYHMLARCLVSPVVIVGLSVHSLASQLPRATSSLLAIGYRVRWNLEPRDYDQISPDHMSSFLALSRTPYCYRQMWYTLVLLVKKW